MPVLWNGEVLLLSDAQSGPSSAEANAAPPALMRYSTDESVPVVPVVRPSVKTLFGKVPISLVGTSEPPAHGKKANFCRSSLFQRSVSLPAHTPASLTK